MLKLRSILLNSKAAIDLASIMVGIIVIGLIGGVIAATVFAVIPWAQDNAAKQQLDSIHTAQNAAFGLSADPSRELPAGQERNSFTNSEGLDTQGFLTQGESYCTTVVGKDDYRAYSKSAAGKIWFASNGDKQAKILSDGTPVFNECADWVEGGENSDSSPTIPDEEPVIYANTTYTLQCDSERPVTLNLREVTGTITWSDGTTQTLNNETPTAKRLKARTLYTVVLEGTFGSFSSYSFENRLAAGCYRSMETWATDAGTVNASGAFAHMTNLLKVPTSIPKTVTDLSAMFRGNALSGSATVINDSNISNWDVSNVKQMQDMFHGSIKFNQPLNNWNVSNVVNMSSMFQGAASFNQPLNEWETDSVTDLSRMFARYTSSDTGKMIFNQNIGGWNVSNVTNLEAIFWHNDTFNQPLNDWNVSQVTNMRLSFYNAFNFNQPLDQWETGNVTNMVSTFESATRFKQDLSGWNINAIVNSATSSRFSLYSGMTAEQRPKF